MSAYGHLTVICGPMFGGKSTELLKRVLWARTGLERDVLVVKPAFDDRYSDTRIVTHDGLGVNAYSITSWSQVEKRADFADSIFLDELQFLDQDRIAGDIIEIVRDLLTKGKNVVANGLDMDIHGSPFRITGQLMAMADEVVKLRSNCSTCGQPATKTFRLVDDVEPEPDGENVVALGSVGVYEPRCNKQWVRKCISTTTTQSERRSA